MAPPGGRGDTETDAGWLDGLYRLNAVIASTGAELEGNLCYHHRDGGYVRRPPEDDFRAKRDRLRQITAGRRAVLEVGVNGGHSAYVMLTNDPGLHYHGVDACFHEYVRPVVAWLEQEFPGRVRFTADSSLTALPRLRREGACFDTFHLDGAKMNYFIDILNAARLVEGDEAVVIMDDTQGPRVSKIWRRCVDRGIARPLVEVGDPTGGFEKNEAGVLTRLGGPRFAAYRAEAAWRRSAWRSGARLRRLRRRLLRLDP